MKLFLIAATALFFNLQAQASVALGDDFLCSLSEEKVKCWADKPPRTLKVPELGAVTKLAVGPEDACVIADGKVACWKVEHPETLLPAPEIPEPIEILAGKRYACATTATELVCWWTKEDKTLEVHREAIGNLKNPKLFLSWYDEVRVPFDSGYLLTPRYESRPCLVDDNSGFCLRVAKYREGYMAHLDPLPKFDPKEDKDTQYRYGANEHVKYGAFACDRHGEKVSCWTDKYPGTTNLVKVPALKNPKALATNAAYACALDDEGVTCWDERGGAVESPFKGIPLDLVSDDLRMCAEYPDQILCTGILSHGQEHYWKSDKLTAMTVTSRQVCATDKKEARCWGNTTQRGNLFPPALENPAELLSSGLFGAWSCARQAKGLNCWGGSREKNNFFVEYPPELGSFVRVVGGTTFGVCAVFTKGGVQCLGWTGSGWDNERFNHYKFPGANFQEVTEVAIGDADCALFGTKLTCRKSVKGDYADLPFEGVKTVKHIAAGSNGDLYILDQDGLKQFNTYAPVPSLERTTKVPADTIITSEGQNGVCYSSQSTSEAACIPARTWAGYNAFSHGEDKIPALKSPRAIKMSGYHWHTKTCAIDREGFKCWGRIFTKRSYK